MSEQEDRTFFDTFMLVLAFLIVFTIVIFAISNSVANRTIADRHHQTADAAERLAERIRPEGRLCLQGQEEECEVRVAAVTRPAAAEEEVAEAGEVDGQQVYNQACTACHGPGIAGAPRTGDDAAWAARMDKGYETLLDHSINGFQGDAGFMPARGGNPNLSDEQVAAALDYMLEQLD
ncbi:c-type cytochrome [Natronospira bacteriovora]|uniref:C-type cytochrome n=1 Tax=Natronospira bacteriovora TaxID=3069753 RepID=A0ABU0WA25_9GAMM|nr:c-type cytochrome [Natronospira sp. AB-CW4]MDQ2069810.1 c-type cytochrome [Natronospira sp. AB-CW4]